MRRCAWPCIIATMSCIAAPAASRRRLRLPAREMGDEGPRPPFGGGAENERGDILPFLQHLRDRLYRVAVADEHGPLHVRFLVDRARRLEAHRLGAQPRFFLHRGLNSTP